MKKVAVAASIVIGVGACGVSGAQERERSGPIVAAPVAELPGAVERAAIHEFEQAALYGAWLDYAYWQDVLKWSQAHEASRRPVSRARGGGSNYAYVGEGDCYNNDIPDYIISRESGGNPNAKNPSSSAWGCAQWIDSTWNANCSDLGAHGSAPVEAQNECANRLWDGGRGSSHWAATR